MTYLIRYRTGGIVHTDQTTIPGTFGSTGTLSVVDGVLDIAASGSEDVIAILLLPDGLSQTEIDRYMAMDYWQWAMMVPHLGGAYVTVPMPTKRLSPYALVDRIESHGRYGELYPIELTSGVGITSDSWEMNGTGQTIMFRVDTTSMLDFFILDIDEMGV